MFWNTTKNRLPVIFVTACNKAEIAVASSPSAYRSVLPSPQQDALFE
jgi:signal recognition particle receptor subunit beta